MNVATLVWDLPIRLFHWLLVALVAVQFASAQFGWLDMQWHVNGGYATLALLLFRVAWGFIGSESARFASFLHTPKEAWRYLRDWRSQTSARHASHDPIGGWASLLMLALLLAIVLTGLASSDDIDWSGPLAAWLSGEQVRALTRWHHRLVDALPWLIGLHLLAVLLHERRDRGFIAAMWHGRRVLEVAAPRLARRRHAFVLLLLIAILLYLLLRRIGA
jgi:cytochrome b